MLSFLSRKRAAVVLALVGLGLLATNVSALQPPKRGDLQLLAKEGKLGKSLERAQALGNNKTDPRLVWNFKRKQMKAVGATDAQVAATLGNTPPPAWQGGLPATGSPKAFALLIEFPEYQAASNQSRADIESKFFGNGIASYAPYESLRNYYQRSSYQQLNLQGTVFEWYTAQHSRSYYEAIGDGPGQECLIEEALLNADAQGHDFKQYDNNNDGVIDAFFVKWTGPAGDWATFWWAYQTSWYFDPNFRLDGKELGSYVWSWVASVAYDGHSDYYARTDIHETGHLLGLPDLYDYMPGVGPEGGVGGLDMMDANWGDHNCFSKYLLDWLTPTVISSGAQTKALAPSGTSKDCVLMMPGANPNSAFGEFFMAQYRKRGAGNDPGGQAAAYENFPTDGMLVWHVDSTLTWDGWDFEYDNSFADHKYVRLMEADGLEHIEMGAWADAEDFYLPPKTFGPGTIPNSSAYNGQTTGVVIDQLGAAGATMSARFRGSFGPEISLNRGSLSSESCLPGNAGIDPDETVTMSIELRNSGRGAATDLTATLVANPGVIPLSGPQNYGPLAPNTLGTRDFSFTARGSCGAVITLNLQLSDAGTDLGTVSIDVALGAPRVALSENFDSVITPNLPVGWTTTSTPSASTKWKTRQGNPDSWPNYVFAEDPATVTDVRLESPALTLSTDSAKLKFRQRIGLETSFDGGVLEISVGGSPYVDIVAAGGIFEAGGYTGSLFSMYGNPLGGRQAWTGTTGIYFTTIVRLPAGLAGETVKFRWRLGTDSSIGLTGWFVDSIVLEDGFACCDSLGLLITPPRVVVPEAGSATFQIQLTSPPATNRVVTISKLPNGDPDLGIQGSSSLTFTPTDYNVPQTVTLTAMDDGDAVDGQATFVCQSPLLHEAAIFVTEDDNDGYTLRVAPQVLNLTEGATGTFQVKLAAMPLSPITVSVSKASGDLDINIQSGTILAFDPQNWDTYQTVTVAAAEDFDAVDEQAQFICSSPGWPSVPVNVFVDDNDVFSIETSTSSLTIPETGLGTFRVRLTAAPVSPVTLSVQRTTGDESIKLKSGSAMRFTAANYSIWQTVTLAADSDADANDGKAAIRVAGLGLESKYVEVNEDDDDTLGIVMDTASVLVHEGYTAGFPVKLGAQPADETTVTVTISGDSDLTVLAGATLTFTPTDWDTYQTVTIQAGPDDDIVSGQAEVRCVAEGMPEKTLIAFEGDDDALEISTTSSPVTVGEMGTASFNVKLTAKPSSDVEVNVEVIPGDPDITLASAAKLTFTPSGPAAWNVTQQVIVAAARDVDTANGEAKVRLSGTGLKSVEVTIVEADDGIEPTVWYEDADNDGAGNAARSKVDWDRPTGYVASDTDCNDADPEVYPGAAENCENLADDNCNGQVNEGCPPPDEDGDGVPDDADECPNTPAGTAVQANGCQPPPPDQDADDDGVLDDADQCPNTPAGTTVGANGCPPPVVDRDADDDGVLDDADQCPNTPAGTTVGANGCPPPPVDNDADDDGVLDNADQCPNTPAGTTVGANGCPHQNEPAGQDQPDDLNDDQSPAPSPMCGAGLAETAMGTLLCLMLVQLRRRTR